MTTPPDSTQKVVSDALDGLGRDLGADGYASLYQTFERVADRAGVGGRELVDRLGHRLPLVVDASAVQRSVRRLLTDGSCQFLAQAEASVFELMAPTRLDDEIARHAKKVARETGSSTEEVLSAYVQRVRPQIAVCQGLDEHLVSVVAKTIVDPNDADYVAAAEQWGAIGVVCGDHGIQAYPGLKSFNIEDLGSAAMAVRKRAVSAGAGGVAATAGGVAIGGACRGLSLAPYAVLAMSRSWRPLLLGAGAVVLLGCVAKALWPKKVARAAEGASHVLETGVTAAQSLYEGFKELLLAFGVAGVERTEEFDQTFRDLGVVWPRGEEPRTPGKPARLTV